MKALVQMWLHEAYIIDVAGMEADLPPPLVIKLNYMRQIVGITALTTLEGGLGRFIFTGKGNL